MTQNIKLSVWIGLAGTALTFVAVIPPWPFYNKNPESWLSSHSAAGITIDVDGLDPKDAPGTGVPEPGGIAMRDMQMILRRLTGLNMIGYAVFATLLGGTVAHVLRQRKPPPAAA